ncbi:hypothetical protein [Leptospira mayottensis]
MQRHIVYNQKKFPNADSR